MSSVLACRLPNRFAAFAPVTVVFFTDRCAGTRPVSIVAFAGTADPIVPFNGGKVNCCGGATVAGAPDSMAGWARHDNCAATPKEVRLSSEVRRRTWHDCDDKSEVVFYIVDGGGHTWPGAIAVPRLGMTTTQINASATIWEFFKSKTLARG
jgi:polyhydroxybutyrate depolymerase